MEVPLTIDYLVSNILKSEHFKVDTLGPCTIPTTHPRFQFVSDNERVLFQSSHTKPEDINPDLAFEIAGQREMMYFQPENTTIGIVTCGGLCPGLNNVSPLHSSFSYLFIEIISIILIRLFAQLPMQL